MLAVALTPNCCRDIVEMLISKRKWSMSRIARTIGAPIEFVRKVRAGKQRLEVSHVKAVAKACRREPALLIFDSMRPEKMKPGAYELVQREVARHEELRRALAGKSSPRRRVTAKAA